MYNLGAKNLSFNEFFQHLSAVSNIWGPWSCTALIPAFVQRWSGHLAQSLHLTRSMYPLLDPVLVEMSQHYWYINSQAAIDEGIFSPRDYVETIMDTVGH